MAAAVSAEQRWGEGLSCWEAMERVRLRAATQSLAQVGDVPSQRAVVEALRRTSSGGAAGAALRCWREMLWRLLLHLSYYSPWVL